MGGGGFFSVGKRLAKPHYNKLQSRENAARRVGGENWTRKKKAQTGGSPVVDSLYF